MAKDWAKMLLTTIAFMMLCVFAMAIVGCGADKAQATKQEEDAFDVAKAQIDKTHKDKRAVVFSIYKKALSLKITSEKRHELINERNALLNKLDDERDANLMEIWNKYKAKELQGID